MAGVLALASRRRKLYVLLVTLVLFTKIGLPNILYLLQYAECILKLVIFKKRIKHAAATAIYRTWVHLYDIGPSVSTFCALTD